MAKKPDITQKLIDAAFDLATEKRWCRLSMAAIASHAHVPLADALAIFPGKNALLDAVLESVDHAALKECSGFQEQDTTKDRLFALLMARFDALAPHRNAIAAIASDIVRSPILMACRLPRTLQSMALMLEAAEVPANGPAGLARTAGLLVVFATTMRSWLRDPSDDMAATMAALDKALSRADRLAQRIC